MKTILLLLSIFFSISSFSQNANKDSLTGVQLKNIVSLYDHYTDGNAPIYNGTEYLYYTFKRDGIPFFYSDTLQRGWVSYEGKIYNPLSLTYDLTRNQVVILFPDSISTIVLQNQFIDSFYLANHTFINLVQAPQQNLYNTGFYDLLYNGGVQLLARRTKLMSEIIKDNSVITVISPKVFFYIHEEGMYYLVNNQKDVFKLFNNKKHELRKEMRKEHLKFKRKNFESVLEKTTALYDHLIH
ncbi:MAG: hypothetical protein M3R50_00025 [Bacteroidota bacterium]|nr:hypothetical protein [Bacteroidota bacterium]